MPLTTLPGLNQPKRKAEFFPSNLSSRSSFPSSDALWRLILWAERHFAPAFFIARPFHMHRMLNNQPALKISTFTKLPL
jgi:hypothetical protein